MSDRDVLVVVDGGTAHDGPGPWAAGMGRRRRAARRGLRSLVTRGRQRRLRQLARPAGTGADADAADAARPRDAVLSLAGADLGIRHRRATIERPFLPGSAIHGSRDDLLVPGSAERVGGARIPRGGRRDRRPARARIDVDGARRGVRWVRRAGAAGRRPARDRSGSAGGPARGAARRPADRRRRIHPLVEADPGAARADSPTDPARPSGARSSRARGGSGPPVTAWACASRAPPSRRLTRPTSRPTA